MVQLLGPDRVEGNRGLRGFHLPLVLTFVDYEKAFDSVETNAILSALVDQGVNASYVRTLANCYGRCTTRIQLFQLTDQDLRAHLFDSTVLPALCVTQRRRGQTPLPRLGSYLLSIKPLRDAF
ncbi:hypothetical protein RB195_015576 [Necator americanus]|uniref:Reverse transcriptase domain-containing protein n=1 Tax=Necator americanus TaxID=51031 RepID=A0ABR1E568_NECAM